MLAGYKGPWTGHPKGDSDSIAGKSLELGFGALTSEEVAVDDSGDANEALHNVSNSWLVSKGKRTSAAQATMDTRSHLRCGNPSRCIQMTARMTITNAMCRCKKVS